MGVSQKEIKGKFCRAEIEIYLKSLRSDILRSFTELEDKYGKGDQFVLEDWSRPEGGGGSMAVLRGDFFEKAAVNFSSVYGDAFPGDDAKGPFYATGVSLITHMKNPKIPTFHFNVRYIETTSKSWFGGGYDMTPMGFIYPDDTQHLHGVAKDALDQVSPELYAQFSQNAADYFYIKHRKKERGEGGIFFDHLDLGDENMEKAVFEVVAESFLMGCVPILDRRSREVYTHSDKLKQLEYRGHYVEFNLVYDRGTRFGFLSGGNTKAILGSLPPLVSW